MASDAQEDVNLDDGRDCCDRLVAASSSLRSTAGQILGKNNWIGVFRYLTASEYANFIFLMSSLAANPAVPLVGRRSRAPGVQINCLRLRTLRRCQSAPAILQSSLSLRSWGAA